MTQARSFQVFRDLEHRYRGKLAVLLTRGEKGEAVIREEPLRVLAAWQGCGATWQVPETECPETEVAAWEWIWEGCSVTELDLDSFAMLAEASGFCPEDTRYYWRILKNARAIYPDGTLSNDATKLVELAVSAVMVPQGLKRKG